MSDLSQEVTVLKALNDKYSEENCAFNEFSHIRSISSKRGARVLYPHEKRTIVALEGCGITSAGKHGEIADVCPLVSELDVTNNRINDWNEVFKIISQLKHLLFLNLCGNPLNDSSYSSTLYLNNLETSAFYSLEKLVLNNTNVSLCTVQRLLKVLPSVAELHVSLNGYSSIPKCEEFCENVKRLHFNGNAIKQWQEVEKLSRMFPNLETLIIMENPLESLQRESKDNSLMFLKVLNLMKTMLSRWEDIDALRKIMSLKEVKLLGIPLVAELKENEVRKLLVARLPNIESLNGSRVDSSERDNAERFFIRQHHDEENPPERYHELLAIHGELEKLADVNLDPVEVANVLLHITGQATRIAKISITQTMGDFKKYISKMLKLPVTKFRVHYHDIGLPFGATKMKFPTRKLYMYGVKDGDEIYVDIHE